ncbi:MAG: nitroreductase family protein [Clostridiales Family XIII bacterium]|jgi:nitroreductase|nr:nitroreductase family protein [Clostridiales Family XIII bacterium]
METLQAIEARKSVRSYSPKAIDPAVLGKVAATANRAPNAGPFQITVVKNKALLDKIDETTLTAMKNSGNDFLVGRASLEGYHPLYGAPVLLLLSAVPEGYATVNAAAAATAVTIAATDQGLGSCYVISPLMAFDGKNELSQQLNLPAGYQPLAGVLLGYADGEKFFTERATPDNVNYVE